MTDLCLLTAHQMLELLKQRKVSCQELIEAHIARIERINPQINAIITTTFDFAVDSARRLDSEGVRERPLFGLPIAHKDLVATKGIRTTFGFPPYAEFIPTQDALIVRRMREAGTVLLGKTNVPEFGAGSHTFNRVFGPTLNPYDPKRTVGGSSGGAAAALCSRMVPLADGSDTGGSLRNPAAFCNVVGFRPSPGRVPWGPNNDPWTELSHQGPMARTVSDTALLFSVLAGPDRHSTRVLETPGATFRELHPVDLSDLRIAYSPDFGGLPVEQPVRQTLSQFATILERCGATVEEATPRLDDARRIFSVLRGLGFRKRFNEMPKEHFNELKETIHWNIAVGNALTIEDVEWAIAARTRLHSRVVEFFETYDVWIGPATQVMPFPVEVDWVREVEGQKMSDYIQWMEACSWISVTGLPTLSLPAGFSNGLPVGVQVIAPPRRDHFLLSVAKSMEDATDFQSQLPLCS